MDRLLGMWDAFADWLDGLRERSPRAVMVAIVAAVAVLAMAVAAIVILGAGEEETPPEVSENTALSFAVLAGGTVQNTGPSVINGDLGGAKPGEAITGFPPGIVNGDQHAADAVALRAQSDLTAAYYDAENRSSVAALPDTLDGLTLPPGVYTKESELGLSGTLTLDGQGDKNALFIFQAVSSLVTEDSGAIELINGAQACNVFWQVGTSATLGADTSFVGSILAFTSVSLQAGTTVEGRVLARNGTVSLDNNTITRPTCDSPPDNGAKAKAVERFIPAPDPIEPDSGDPGSDSDSDSNPTVRAPGTTIRTTGSQATVPTQTSATTTTSTTTTRTTTTRTTTRRTTTTRTTTTTAPTTTTTSTAPTTTTTTTTTTTEPPTTEPSTSSAPVDPPPLPTTDPPLPPPLPTIDPPPPITP
ncbi:MAG: ice-binding family protein [Geodermatophilaceae bacterium]